MQKLVSDDDNTVLDDVIIHQAKKLGDPLKLSNFSNERLSYKVQWSIETSSSVHVLPEMEEIRTCLKI